MRRSTLAVGVCLLLALAGCSGPAGPTDPDAVPGVTNGTLENASALAAANVDALGETGGAVAVSRTEGGETVGYTLTVAEGFETYRLNVTETGEQELDVETWGNDTRYQRLADGDDVRYVTGERRRFARSLTERLGRYVAAGNYTVNGTTERGVVLVADEPAPAPERPDRTVPTPVTAYDGRVVVAENGTVLSATVELDSTDGPLTYEYERVETGIEEVPPPTWVRAAAATAPVEADLVVGLYERTALTLTHEGGERVPASVQVSVETNGTSATLSPETPLSAGDTRYIYRAADSGELVLSTEPPADGEATPLTSPASVTVTTEDGASLVNTGLAWASASGGSSTGTPAEGSDG